MGARLSGADAAYAAADAWVGRALRSDDSLFTPARRIWTSEWLGELHQRFLNRPDESGLCQGRVVGADVGQERHLVHALGEVHDAEASAAAIPAETTPPRSSPAAGVLGTARHLRRWGRGAGAAGYGRREAPFPVERRLYVEGAAQ